MLVRCAGARPDVAESCATDLLKNGCRALLSFGIAGGLAADLHAGQVVIANSVVMPGGKQVATAANWRERLVSALPRNGDVVVGPVCGSETVIAEVGEKLQMFRQTGAIAVDMESHRVARVAAAAGVPFMVIRAISDDFAHTIPSIALGAISEKGTPRYGKILLGLLTNPGDIPGVMRLSRDSESALASLRRVALAAAPLFRFA